MINKYSYYNIFYKKEKTRAFLYSWEKALQNIKIYTILDIDINFAPTRVFFKIQKTNNMAQQRGNFLIRYFSEVQEEMKKVTWPTRKQVQNSTILVIIISLIIAGFFGSLDFIFTYILEYLLAT